MRIGYATVKRVLSQLIVDRLTVTSGRGRGTKYSISPTYNLVYPIDVDAYFTKEIDERVIKSRFNPSLITEVLVQTRILSNDEEARLNKLQATYEENISRLTPSEHSKEMERLAIDLSWKSWACRKMGVLACFECLSPCY